MNINFSGASSAPQNPLKCRMQADIFSFGKKYVGREEVSISAEKPLQCDIFDYSMVSKADRADIKKFLENIDPKKNADEYVNLRVLDEASRKNKSPFHARIKVMSDAPEKVVNVEVKPKNEKDRAALFVARADARNSLQGDEELPMFLYSFDAKDKETREECFQLLRAHMIARALENADRCEHAKNLSFPDRAVFLAESALEEFDRARERIKFSVASSYRAGLDARIVVEEKEDGMVASRLERA